MTGGLEERKKKMRRFTAIGSDERNGGVGSFALGLATHEIVNLAEPKFGDVMNELQALLAGRFTGIFA